MIILVVLLLYKREIMLRFLSCVFWYAFFVLFFFALGGRCNVDGRYGLSMVIISFLLFYQEEEKDW